MPSNRVFNISILVIMLSLILAWAPLIAYSNNGNIMLYATLYSDGSVSIKGVERYNVNQSSKGYYLLNVTFYKDHTTSYTKYAEYIPIQPFNQPKAIKGRIDLTSITKNGETRGNTTYILERTDGTLNGTTRFRVYKNGSNWFMWSHITMKSTGSFVSMGSTDIRNIVKSIGGKIIDYHRSMENDALVIDITLVVPYKNTPIMLYPFSATPSIIAYIYSIPSVTVNNPVLVSQETHTRFNSTTVEMESKSIYKAGFNQYLKSQADMFMKLNKTAPDNGIANLTRLIYDLAANYTVKSGTSLIVEANDTVYLVKTPVIKEKNAKNPLETLLSLRDLAIRTGMISSKESVNLLNVTIILKPGDSGVKSIKPSQTTVSNLDEVKVELGGNSKDTMVLLAGIVIVLLVAVGAAIVFVKRQ